MNGAKRFKSEEIVFDAERAKQEAERNGNTGQQNNQPILAFPIDDATFTKNLFFMCALFSIFSFCFWLIDYQQEYLGTDIYVNFYIAGGVSISSGHVCYIMNTNYGMRKTVQLIQIVSLISCSFIIAVQ